MTDPVPVRRALLSVSDKTGLVEFARFLAAQGVEILSTGGTAKAPARGRHPGDGCQRAYRLPGDPGRPGEDAAPAGAWRHPGRRDRPEHLAQMAEHGIAPIDLVVVNLYPFEATVAQGAGFDDCIENIDIGGPAMIRGAAKNHAFVRRGDRSGATTPRCWPRSTRTGRHHAWRCAAGWRPRPMPAPPPTTPRSPAGSPASSARPSRRAWPFAGMLRADAALRREPAPAAAFYVDGTRAARRRHGAPGPGQGAVLQQPQRHRRGLRVRAPSSTEPAVAIVKHANPCGVAVAADLAEAWDKALRLRPGLAPSAASSRSTGRSTRRRPRRSPRSSPRW